MNGSCHDWSIIRFVLRCVSPFDCRRGRSEREFECGPFFPRFSGFKFLPSDPVCLTFHFDLEWKVIFPFFLPVFAPPALRLFDSSFTMVLDETADHSAFCRCFCNSLFTKSLASSSAKSSVEVSDLFFYSQFVAPPSPSSPPGPSECRMESTLLFL